LTAEEKDDRKMNPTDRSVDLDAKDYVALTIAMAETTMLPLILLAFVLAAVGIIISTIFLH
jgi:hypothetical protein